MLRFFQRIALRLLVRFTLVLAAIWYVLHTLGSSEGSDLQQRVARVLLLLIFCGAFLILVSLLGKAAARRRN